MRASSTVFLAIALLLSGPALIRADEVLKPTKAYSAYLKDMRRVPPSEKAEEGKRWALDYLGKWAATGEKATGAQRYALAQFQQLAEQYVEAAEGFRTVQADTSQKQRTRDFAATAEGAILLVPELRAKLSKEAIDEALARLGSYADEMTSDQQMKSCGKLRTVLARLLDMAGRPKEGVAMRMKIIDADPAQLPDLVRPIMYGLREMTHTMGGYDELRQKVVAVMKTLREHNGAKIAQAKRKLESMRGKLREINPGALGSDGRLLKEDPKDMDAGERAVYSAQRSYDGAVELGAEMDAYEKTIALLGTPAPNWTLEKEYGDIKAIADLKGKVVVMDFWLTSGARCNFPVMRDLMKAYAGKPFTVLGVTASSHVVYEARYDFDDDLSHKVELGARKQYAARLASESAPADPSAAILPEEAYRETEMRVIGSFIGNHGLEWPTVMIDDPEPEAKYALEGWPFLLILDKQGRIRHMKTASLGRDKPEMVAAFRKVIDDLLAE